MPYTYKKQGSKYVVYKKSTGKKVGETDGTKTALKKYLAALQINDPDNKKAKKESIKESMEYENKVGQLYVVQKPSAGCDMAGMVYEVDPVTGIQPHGVDAQTVHGVYATMEEAQEVAEKLYDGHMTSMKKLEEKKGSVANKLSKAITTLEKKHKDLMEMAKTNPKDASAHKGKIAEIQAKIQELMDKLEMVEKSKKPIEEKGEDKEKKDLKENEGGSFETDLKKAVKDDLKIDDEDRKLDFYKNKATLDYKRGTRLADEDVEALQTKFKVYPHEDESDDRLSYFYYTVEPKSMTEADKKISSEEKMVETFVKKIAKEFDYSTKDASNFIVNTIKKLDL
jgi:hypothetical protein